MKIYRKAVLQMTRSGFEPIFEDSFEYLGPVSEAKGGGNLNPINQLAKTSGPFGDAGVVGQLINPAGYAAATQKEGAGPFDPGGVFNKVLDPLDLFGGQAKGDAIQAKKDLPGQLSDLNNLQANVSRYNTNGPFGTSEWSIDPATGRYTQTTKLAPSEQKQFDSRNQIAEQMLGKAKEWAPNSSFDYNKDVPAIAAQQLAKTNSLTSPVMAQGDDALKAKLANMGISGTDAASEAIAARGVNNTSAAQSAQRNATTAAIPLAQQQRQQRMTEIAQLLGSQQLNSPALGGNGVDINGATNAANQVGINNANQSAAQRNANMQAIASGLQLAYPRGFG